MSHNVCYDYNKCLWNLQPCHVVEFRGERWLVVGVQKHSIILSNRESGKVVAVSDLCNVNERLRLCTDAFWDCYTNCILTVGCPVTLCDALAVDDVKYTIFRVDQKRCRVGLRVARSDGTFVTLLWVDFDDIVPVLVDNGKE